MTPSAVPEQADLGSWFASAARVALKRVATISSDCFMEPGLRAQLRPMP